MSDKTMLWLAQQRCRAMRVQPNADGSDAPRAAQVERREQLTGEEHSGLALPLALYVGLVRAHPLERIAKMENDLGTAIWQDRLRGGHFAHVSIERPDTFHHPGEWRRGLKFPVSHPVLRR